MSGVGPGGGNGGSESSDDNKSGGPRKKLKEMSNDPDFPSTDEDCSEDGSVSPVGGKASGSELSLPSSKSVPSGKAETSTGAQWKTTPPASSDESVESTAGSRPIQGSPSGASQGESEQFENLTIGKNREQTWQELRDRIVYRLEKENAHDGN